MPCNEYRRYFVAGLIIQALPLPAAMAWAYKPSMQPTLRHLARECLKPLALASYAALAAIWAGVPGLFGLPGELPGAASTVLLALFTAAWLWAMASDSSRIDWRRDLCLLILTATALGLISLGRSGLSPILLILLATLLPLRFAGWRVFAVLALINLAFAGLMLWRWHSPWLMMAVTVSAYGAFQLFAVLLMHYARRAEAMAEDLRAVNAHLLTTRYLLDEAARDQERLRLSRELHDVTGHKLTALKLNLRQLQRDPALAGIAELAQAGQLADELLGDIRGVVRQLRASDGIDLARGLEQLARPFPRPRLELDIEADLRLERAEQAEALLRLVQEALTNAARHGQAEHLWVQLRDHDETLQLQLDDDGATTWPIRPGNGLTGMRERIEALGGALSLQASAKGGLSISAQLPKAPPA